MSRVTEQEVQDFMKVIKPIKERMTKKYGHKRLDTMKEAAKVRAENLGSEEVILMTKEIEEEFSQGENKGAIPNPKRT